MRVSSFKGCGNHFNSIIITERNTGTYALERVLGIDRNVIQLLIFHYIIQPEVVVNSEKEKQPTYPQKVQNTIPAPHSFIFLIFLTCKLMTFR